MQLGESFEPLKEAEWQHDKSICPFCNSIKSTEPIVNKHVDKFDEGQETREAWISEARERLKKETDATKLEGQLKAAGIPDPADRCRIHVSLRGDETTVPTVNVPIRTKGNVFLSYTVPVPVIFSAHHLIPGNGSLSPSALLPLLRKDGAAKGNIGYDVNRHQNGVWLPTPWALIIQEKWDDVRMVVSSDEVEKNDFVAAAMIAHGQLHFNHNQYNSLVKKTLNEINEKYGHVSQCVCPIGKGQIDDEDVSLLSLVSRLDCLSGRLRSYVEKTAFPMIGDGGKWKRNLFTSTDYGNGIDVLYDKTTGAEFRYSCTLAPRRP
jgi:hypothetical protein